MKSSGKSTARVIILGAGDHAHVVADSLLAAMSQNQKLEPIGYLDDDPKLLGKKFLGLPVLGSIAQRHLFQHDAVVVAIGHNATRARIFAELEQEQAWLVNVIHPTATLAAEVELGRGVVIMAGVVVNTGSVIGNNVILNTSCSVDHHGYIGGHAHLGPGTHLGGRVTIGEGALLGVGAVVLPGKHVGAWSIVGAGGCVVSNIPDAVTAVGVPAKIIKD